VIENTIANIQRKRLLPEVNVTDQDNDNNNDVRLMLCLPYKGQAGETLSKKIKTKVRKAIGENVKVNIAHKSRKLSTLFNIKDNMHKEHVNDIIYEFKCPQENCSAKYIGETLRRFHERIMDHCGRDNKSHIAQHTVINDHTAPSPSDFRVIDKGFRGNKFTRKISEALLIKRRRPILNVQEQSIPLKLFN